jgi:hypothetical protein
VRERRRRLSTDDRWSLVDEVIVHERLDHELGEVDTAGEVALENRTSCQSRVMFQPHENTRRAPGGA